MLTSEICTRHACSKLPSVDSSAASCGSRFAQLDFKVREVVKAKEGGHVLQNIMPAVAMGICLVLPALAQIDNILGICLFLTIAPYMRIVQMLLSSCCNWSHFGDLV